MRITQEAKQATRKRILDVAQKLFQSRGFDETTTRDIAREAGIATGTLFNYFATKEGIIMTFVAEALERAQDDFEDKRPDDNAPLEEQLFALIATGLRRMKPYRKYIQPALESALSPLAKITENEAADAVRVNHLETVQRLMRNHGLADTPSAVGMHLYWTLYIGLLAFWANDNSPKQEDTLALLDQSLRMFVSWLGSDIQNFE